MKTQPMRLFAALLLLLGFSLVGCGKKTDSVPATSNPPEPAKPDEFARFQGNWKLAKIELVPGGNSPEIDPVTDDDLKRVDVAITGKLLKLSRRGKGWARDQFFVLTPVAGKSPDAIDLIDSDATGTTSPRSLPTAKDGKPFMMEVPRQRYAAIYKFEGETLVVAVAFEEDCDRPTEFKPKLLTFGTEFQRKIPVAVIHLKK